MKKSRLGVRSLWAGLITALLGGYCPPMPSVQSPEWQYVDEEELPCPDPQGLCVWDIQFNGITFPTDVPIGGYVFQKVNRNWAWVGCGPNPPSDSGNDSYYERFLVQFDDFGGSPFIQEDVFSTARMGDDEEYVDTVIGDGIFVPLNAATEPWLFSVARLKNRKGKVLDNNGDGIGMTMPDGSFDAFNSGALQNQVDPPSYTDEFGDTYSWGNNFGGHGIPVGEHRLEWNHVCCTNDEWTNLECLPD